MPSSCWISLHTQTFAFFCFAIYLKIVFYVLFLVLKNQSEHAFTFRWLQFFHRMSSSLNSIIADKILLSHVHSMLIFDKKKNSLSKTVAIIGFNFKYCEVELTHTWKSYILRYCMSKFSYVFNVNFLNTFILFYTHSKQKLWHSCIWNA